LLCSLDPRASDEALGIDDLLRPEAAPRAGPAAPPGASAAPWRARSSSS
jgi:hypothetical protein